MNLQEWPVYLINGIAAALTLLVLGWLAMRQPNVRRPGRMQNFFEWSTAGLTDLFRGALGPNAEQHLPLVLALFFYILFCNLTGLIPSIIGTYPDGKLAEPYITSATAATSTTVALALIVFFYVQYMGIKSKGLLGYLKHFLGPVPFIGFIPLFILFLPIEIIGEFVKPFSLSMRLFGNIYGEDVINQLALGAGSHFFIPAQFVINLLQTFTDVVQAFIFALLTCAYISIMSDTHGHDGHENDFASVEHETANRPDAQLGAVSPAKIGVAGG
ncbi:MAG: F0F1 ATP synthase subunit A [Armatimonadetes bacterium]|nr:F0F1 ATP synthase subunit A [Armatimonadota bacterium]